MANKVKDINHPSINDRERRVLEAVFFKIVVTLCLNIKLHLLRLLLVPYLG